jgi:hypothetical protein
LAGKGLWERLNLRPRQTYLSRFVGMSLTI